MLLWYEQSPVGIKKKMNYSATLHAGQVMTREADIEEDMGIPYRTGSNRGS